MWHQLQSESCPVLVPRPARSYFLFPFIVAARVGAHCRRLGAISARLQAPASVLKCLVSPTVCMCVCVYVCVYVCLVEIFVAGAFWGQVAFRCVVSVSRLSHPAKCGTGMCWGKQGQGRQAGRHKLLGND